MTKYSDKASAIKNKLDAKYNKATYSQTVASNAEGAYEIGKITVDGTQTTIYGQNTQGSISPGTFTDLQTLITNASSADIITLDKDYKYDNTTDSSLTSGVVIDKNITINANGHIIDGNNTSMAFSMTGANNNRLTLTLENIIVQNCNSSNGAIYLTQYCTLNIIDSIFNNNTSTTNGGAIYGYVRCTINIYNSIFSNNKATEGSGGAIYLTNYITTDINASTFINNTASSEGGAICTAWYPNFTLLHSRIEYNSANKGGGLQIGNANVGTFNVRNNIITSNIANTFANVVVYNGAVSAYNCILLDNASTYSNFNNYNYVDTNLIIDNLTTNDATKVLSAKQGKSLQDNKQATLVSGTNIKTINNNSLLGSGNITIGSEVGTFTDLQTLITNASSGDTIVLDKDYKYDSTTDSSLSSGIEIPDDIIIIGNGHIIDGNNYARAFIDENGYTWELNDLKIQNCTSDNDNKYGYPEGGAIITINSQLNITNSTINNNTASEGGAIYTDNSKINITQSILQNNQTYNSSGAIYVDDNSEVNITQSNITNNQTTGDGGAIYKNDGILNIKESIIKNNQANNCANIYSDDSIIIYNCEINDISTTCNGVTNYNYATENLIGQAITYINS